MMLDRDMKDDILKEPELNHSTSKIHSEMARSAHYESQSSSVHQAAKNPSGMTNKNLMKLISDKSMESQSKLLSRKTVKR